MIKSFTQYNNYLIVHTIYCLYILVDRIGFCCYWIEVQIHCFFRKFKRIRICSIVPSLISIKHSRIPGSFDFFVTPCCQNLNKCSFISTQTLKWKRYSFFEQWITLTAFCKARASALAGVCKRETITWTSTHFSFSIFRNSHSLDLLLIPWSESLPVPFDNDICMEFEARGFYL